MPGLLPYPQGLDGIGPARYDEPPPQIHPWFDGAPQLPVEQLPPLALVNTALTALPGPATTGQGASFYVFCARVLVEVDLRTSEVRRFDVPFDSHQGRIYSYAASSACLAEDGRIYFGLAAQPTRVGRFDPATCEMTLLGEVSGWTPVMWTDDRNGTLYFVTYPGMLNSVDTDTGKVQSLGRMTHDGLYVHQSGMAAADDGLLYCAPGPRDFRLVVFDPKNQEVDEIGHGRYRVVANRGRPYAKRLDDPACEPPFGPPLLALYQGKAVAVDQPPEPGPWPETPSEQLAAAYDIQWDKQGAEVKVEFRPKGDTAWQRVTFEAPVRYYPQESIFPTPDNTLMAWGMYQTVEYDPAQATARHRSDLTFSAYDGVRIGRRLYVCGYPGGRLVRYDVDQPVQGDPRGRDPDRNPFEFPPLGEIPEDGRPIGIHRIWQMCQAADGNVYMAGTGVRRHRGGALVWMDPDTETFGVLRQPFLNVAPRCVMPFDEGRKILIATWVSPDPRCPDAEPDSAPLLVFDTASTSIERQWTPVPGLKVLCGLFAYAPGRALALAKPDTPVLFEADDTFYGRDALLFLDLDAERVLGRVDLPFSASRRTGRPIRRAPDGSLWLSGGGGIVRIDTDAMTAEPLAHIGGADGDFWILGDHMVMVGESGLRRVHIAQVLSDSSAPIEQGAGS